ncbi:IAA-alanine resistance protein 1 [Ranunculus cassubicifolius]
MKIQSLHLSIYISIMLITLCFAHDDGSGSHHHCSHGHHHHGHDEHEHHHHVHYGIPAAKSKKLLPEELAEMEDLELYGFDHGHAEMLDHEFVGDSELSNLSLWIYAMGCSLLVSMASLICLIILPVLLFQGKPSKTFVNSLAAFGAGAMLGDAFLHQLPHAFGGGHSHSHDHHVEHNHDHLHQSQTHSHSLKDLSVGLSTLSGIVLFLLVEKVVRYVEEHSSGNVANAWGHSHHHHHHHKKNDDINDTDETLNSESDDGNNEKESETSPKSKALDKVCEASLSEPTGIEKDSLRQRVTRKDVTDEDKPDLASSNGPTEQSSFVTKKIPDPPSSNLVFGYLNLFSDGVHNFTDGMALGSAFLLHGTVGGWSRTLFLLAHEIPQEVGDFGILVRSGFSVSKALFFNFLSALVALAGTALALVMGQDPGQSSLIEGFTAGGFIYIAVAGVLPELNSGKLTFKGNLLQLTSLILGMGVALCISLVE